MVGSAGFLVVRASENGQASGLYVHGDLYYLIVSMISLPDGVTCDTGGCQWVMA